MPTSPRVWLAGGSVSVAAPSARRDEIVAAARQILETEGPSHLTMRSLAERLEMRAPSLYKHVADKDELEALLIAEALRGMGEALHAALDGLPSRGSKKRRARHARAGVPNVGARASPSVSPGDRGRVASRRCCPRGSRRGPPSRSFV